MVMPIGAKTFAEGLRMAAETFHRLKAVLKAKGYNTWQLTARPTILLPVTKTYWKLKT